MKTFLTIDYYLQITLFLLMGISIVFFPIAMFILAILGGWQLLSGFITAVFFSELDRKYYLLKSAGYLLLLGLSDVLQTYDLLPAFLDNFMGFLIFVILVPFVFAIWYFNMLKIDYHNIPKNSTVPSNQLMMNSPMEKELSKLLDKIE